MTKNTIDETMITVDLSDLQLSDETPFISSLTSDDITSLSLDDMTFSYDINSSSSTTFTYPTAAAGVYQPYAGLSSQTITISPNTYTTNSATWANPYGSGNIQIQGDANVDGTLKVKGVDIGETLSKIQEQLAIYQPAPELEEKWEELRELARKYKELVADIKEKEAMWAILKK